MTVLLENASTGNGPTNRVPQHARPESEQFFTLYVWGTFNGATVRLEIAPNSSSTWFDSGLALTEQTAVNIEFKARRIRCVVDGGSSPSISAEIL